MLKPFLKYENGFALTEGISGVATMVVRGGAWSRLHSLGTPPNMPASPVGPLRKKARSLRKLAWLQLPRSFTLNADTI